MRSRPCMTLVAIVGLMAPAAVLGGGSISVPAPGLYVYSSEGLALSGTASVTLPPITVTIGNNLTYQDDILITLPGATSVAPAVTPGLVSCVGAGASAVGYVSTVPGGWNFRITEVTGITVGATCTFTGLAVTAPSIAGSSGELHYQANRGLTRPVVIVDGPASTGVILESRSQFGVATDQPLNGIVNVYAGLLAFFDAETVPPGNVPPPDNVLSDTLNFSTYTTGSPPVVAWSGPTVDVEAATVTVTGDFSWVDADSDGACEAGEFSAAILGYVGWSIDAASSCMQLVLAQDAPAGDAAATGYFHVPGTVVLDTEDWTGTATFAYSLTGDASRTGSTTISWDPGAWTINATQVYVQYLPYGAGIARRVYAANRGVFEPAVTAAVIANGGAFSCPLGRIPPQSVSDLGAALDACVAAHGIASGRVAVRLSISAPDRDIEVYSAYVVGGHDTGTVINTSNGRRFFYGTGITIGDVVPD